MNAIRPIIVVGISAYCLFVAGPSMFVNPPVPYAGISLAGPVSVQASIHVDVASNSPAYRAGLRTGDTIACLSPEDANVVFPTYPPYARYTGKPISLCYHDRTWHSAAFVPARLPPVGYYYGSISVAALRLAVYAIFLFVGCALVMMRSSVMTWLLFGYCVASMPNACSQAMLVGLPSTLYTVVTTSTGAWIDIGAIVLALFALTVPSDSPPRGWRRTTAYALSAAAVAGLAFGIASDLRTDWSLTPIISWVDEAFTAVTVVVVIGRLATMARAERARFGWAAFAIVFGVIVNDVRNVVPSVAVSSAAGMLTVVMPIALMYAILRRHVIDVRFVLSRTLVYGIVTTLVVAVIGVVDWATSVYLSQARAALAIDAAVTIALGIALHRSYRWVETGVDALIFRRKHEAEAYLHRAARAILRARNESTIDEALVADPVEKLDLTMSALFRIDDGEYGAVSAAGWDVPQEFALAPGCDLVRFLESERTRLVVADLRKHVSAEFVEAGALPAVAIPIFRGDELLAFVLYGLHRDGTQLDPDETDALEHLCEAAAQAYVMVELRRYSQSAATLSPVAVLPT